MEKVAVVLLAHGSRNQDVVVSAMEEIRSRASFFSTSKILLYYAFLQFNRPRLEEVLRECRGSNVRKVYVLPYFLLPGRHLTEDIPETLAHLKNGFPDLEIHLGESIGSRNWFFDSVVRWLFEELPEPYWADGIHCETGPSGTEICGRSLYYAESLLRLGEEIDIPTKKLLSRIIHSTGDPAIAAKVKWSEGALEAGVRAFLQGRDIITDVKMVKVGLNHGIALRLGCRIYCAAEASEGLAPTTGTRISKGMSSLARNMHGAIVAIGNAPSALLSLLKAAKEGGPVPSLVVGMPVGFVQAAEAKELLASSGLPYITVAGSRGGSPVAVAAVNALLEFADERSVEKARVRCRETAEGKTEGE